MYNVGNIGKSKKSSPSADQDTLFGDLLEDGEADPELSDPVDVLSPEHPEPESPEHAMIPDPDPEESWCRCPDRGEEFDREVWHCPGCDHHWIVGDEGAGLACVTGHDN